MDLPALTQRLESFPALLLPAIAEWTEEDAHWRPAPGAWSVTEIVAHLGYSEVEDFRPRLASLLEDPQRPWPSIDPEGVVKERNFQGRDALEEARTFARERADSATWLRSLTADLPWGGTYEHPQLGPLRAGDILAAWAAHDALHLRQLAQRRHQITERDLAPYSSAYAGLWP